MINSEYGVKSLELTGSKRDYAKYEASNDKYLLSGRKKLLLLCNRFF